MIHPIVEGPIFKHNHYQRRKLLNLHPILHIFQSVLAVLHLPEYQRLDRIGHNKHLNDYFSETQDNHCLSTLNNYLYANLYSRDCQDLSRASLFYIGWGFISLKARVFTPTFEIKLRLELIREEKPNQKNFQVNPNCDGSLWE